MPSQLSIEAAILDVLQEQEQGQMRIEQLVRALPGYTCGRCSTRWMF